jgi:hypothetical protein
MTALRTLKKLVLGETWVLPVGVAVVVGSAALLVRPLAASAWHRLGGIFLLVEVLALLLISVTRAAR